VGLNADRRKLLCDEVAEGFASNDDRGSKRRLETRAAAACSSVSPPPNECNCLGTRSVEMGQSLVPEAPQRSRGLTVIGRDGRRGRRAKGN
jgi:hypothetical protein